MRVLVGCEFSGVVREAFRRRGHDAMSCDLLPSEDNSEHHYQGDIKDILDGAYFNYDDPDDGLKLWDLAIFHPPCTWLCQAMRTNAARKDRPNITPIFEDERQKAYDFVMELYNAPIEKIAVENPIGYLNQVWRKPDQIVRPWMFGHEYKKDVCLWLKNLPKLEPTNVVEGPYKKLDFWSNKRNPGGYSLKSKTFQGIGDAMADQWG